MFKRSFCTLLFLAFFICSSIAQIYNQSFSIGDISPYLVRYAEPFTRAMSISMNSGWAHSAKVHKTFGFDLSIGASYVQVPSSDLTFNPQELSIPGYSFIGEKAPTISSDEKIGSTFITKQFIDGVPFGFSIPVLKGLNISYGAMLNLQASFGLFKGTDIIVRYIPDISSSSNRLIEEDIQVRRTGLIGGGIKHDVKQWIPKIKKLSFLDVSVMLTYSSFYTGFEGADMRIDPQTLGVSSIYPETTWDNQRFDIDMSSFTSSFLIGMNISFFQPYVSIGYNISTFKGQLLGDFPIVSFSLVNPMGIVESHEVNPISFKQTTDVFNFQGGARLKFGFFAMYYTYTWHDYTIHSGGFSFILK
jgi:hypothetical protein